MEDQKSAIKLFISHHFRTLTNIQSNIFTQDNTITQCLHHSWWDYYKHMLIVSDIRMATEWITINAKSKAASLAFIAYTALVFEFL